MGPRAAYSFPGNVRELENIIERAFITCMGSLIKLEDLQIEQEKETPEQEHEKERILKVFEQVSGNRTLAARMLGMHRTTLWRKLRELGIK